jgi:hypothetical protein
MAGSGETLGSPWPPLALHPCTVEIRIFSGILPMEVLQSIQKQDCRSHGKSGGPVRCVRAYDILPLYTLQGANRAIIFHLSN